MTTMQQDASDWGTQRKWADVAKELEGDGLQLRASRDSQSGRTWDWMLFGRYGRWVEVQNMGHGKARTRELGTRERDGISPKRNSGIEPPSRSELLRLGRALGKELGNPNLEQVFRAALGL